FLIQVARSQILMLTCLRLSIVNKVTPQVMQQNQGGGNWRQPKDKQPVKRQTPFHSAISNCKVGGKEWSHSKDVITKEEFEMICRCVITEVTAFLKDMASHCSPESTL
ncbi:hypothetical protein CHARACLAT_003694, partial [Characodon lateralis]|nr:hypothetical protein [Characodon lateralis]